ncbi:anaerobic sulfatase maturase, partial [Desulfovibrio sp. OttesenSCG-928-A18]|nr:anaerobic sulfatase maturase [Desulfovibrio sp. OttesenSCG-928-A18]
MAASAFPFHLMAKPVGNTCNLACDYCFYLEKGAVYAGPPRLMDDELLEAYIHSTFNAQPKGAEITFTWQGGEPTLAGLEFFEKAVALQSKLAEGRKYGNSFQTNGLLIDGRWADFLARHDFLVGLSLDGPADLHDIHRRTPGGEGSHSRVMRAFDLLKRRGVAVNILCCVTRSNQDRALELYQFFRESGVEFIQFIPVLERRPGEAARRSGLRLGCPDSAGEPTPWSAGGLEYGRFLTDIFMVWVKRDVGKIFIMNFEWALANYLGLPGAACHHQPLCGRCPVLEHDGSVYACDHYVYPGHRLGDLRSGPLTALVDHRRQWDFGEVKKSLGARCRDCPFLRGCWGGCPKHRFVVEEEEPQNYFCPGYRHFYQKILPFLQALAHLHRQGRPLSDITGLTLVLAGREARP